MCTRLLFRIHVKTYDPIFVDFGTEIDGTLQTVTVYMGPGQVSRVSFNSVRKFIKIGLVIQA